MSFNVIEGSCWAIPWDLVRGPWALVGPGGPPPGPWAFPWALVGPCGEWALRGPRPWWALRGSGPAGALGPPLGLPLGSGGALRGSGPGGAPRNTYKLIFSTSGDMEYLKPDHF